MISTIGDNMATALFPNLRLRQLARKAVQDVKTEALSGPEKFEKALAQLVTAVDEAHTYPKSWGLAGKALEAGDGPLLRWILGALLQEAYESEFYQDRI